MTSNQNDGSCSLQGWTWDPDGGSRCLRDWSAIDAAWQVPEARLWIDIAYPTRAIVDRLAGIVDLDEAVQEDCLSGPERPRVDEYDNYLVVFLFGVLSTNSAERSAPRRLMIVCGQRFLITVHQRPLPSVTMIFDRCRKHGARMFERGVDLLFYRLVDALVDNYLECLDLFDDEVNELEVSSLDADGGDLLLANAARVRSDLLDVRRLAAAQRSLLAPIVRGEFDMGSEQLNSEFRHVQEHLAHAIDRVDAMRDRVAGALSNHHTVLAKRTNDIVRVLTVFAALVLPLTLISGVYGMNVQVWPPADQTWSFWVILGVMGCTAGALLWFFRTRDWF